MNEDVQKSEVMIRYTGKLVGSYELCKRMLESAFSVLGLEVEGAIFVFSQVLVLRLSDDEIDFVHQRIKQLSGTIGEPPFMVHEDNQAMLALNELGIGEFNGGL